MHWEELQWIASPNVSTFSYLRCQYLAMLVSWRWGGRSSEKGYIGCQNSIKKKKKKRKNGGGCFHHTSFPCQGRRARAKRAQPLLNPQTYTQSHTPTVVRGGGAWWTPLSFWYIAIFRNDFAFSEISLWSSLQDKGILYGWWSCWRPVTSPNMVAILAAN